jgi:hypothetical protein
VALLASYSVFLPDIEQVIAALLAVLASMSFNNARYLAQLHYQMLNKKPIFAALWLITCELQKILLTSASSPQFSGNGSDILRTSKNV